MRKGHLDSLAEAIAEEGNSDKQKVLTELRQREAQRNTAWRIRFLRGKFISGSTTTVTVTTPDGQVSDLTSKEAVENAILTNNQKKFQQSFHLPFLQNPLKQQFGFKSLMTAARAVLAGVYECAEDIDPYVKDFLHALRTPQVIKERGHIDMLPSLESYCSFWHKAKEKTSCYPGPLSFATL